MSAAGVVIVLAIIASVLLYAHARGVWPGASIGAAITGFAWFAMSVACVGAAIMAHTGGEVAVSLVCAATAIVWAMFIAGPWFVREMLKEADRHQRTGRQASAAGQDC